MEDDNTIQYVGCPVCGQKMPVERQLLGWTCVSCKNEAPYVGSIEGVAKQGSLNIAKAGTEEARRIFNGGTAIIRRNTPRSIRVRKGGD